MSVLGITSGVGPGQIPGTAADQRHGDSRPARFRSAARTSCECRSGFPSGIGNTGPLWITRGIWTDVAPPNGEIDTGEYTIFEDEEPTELPCLPTVDPNRQLGMQVHLPIMNYIGNDDRCNTWIEVQNVEQRRRSRPCW